MRKLLIAIATLFLSVGVFAQAPCYSTSVPSTYPGFSGGGGTTTPTAISGTGGTGCNGVTTASIDVVWGQYNTVIGYVTSSGGNQSTQDMIEVMPHECIATPSKCEVIFYWHGGGGYSGTNGETGNGDPFGTGTALEAVNMVQALVGRPNRVGGNLTAYIIPNYRETVTGTQLDAGTVTATTNIFPANYQDAKCPIWYAIANQSQFPGNYSIVGLQGGSWGGTMAYLAGATSDTAYTTSCTASAPGTDPVYFAHIGWPYISWFADSTGSFSSNNGMYDNALTGIGAGLAATTAQLYLSGDTTIVQYYPTQNPSTIEATLHSHCLAIGTSPVNCDPGSLINSSNLAVLKKFHVYYQFGTPTNTAGTGDTLVRVYCNIGGITTGCTGGAPTGQLYNIAAYYVSSGALMPVMQILWSQGTAGQTYCIHEGDLSQGPTAPSWLMGINWLLGSNTTSGYVGGNGGGNGG